MKTLEIELIEKVSEAIAQEFSKLFDSSYKVIVFTGKGNNGSDGLAVARILSGWGYSVSVVTLFDKNQCSKEYKINIERLPSTVKICSATEYKFIPHKKTIFIDSIFGTGVKNGLNLYINELFELLNNSGQVIVSIDLPSGLGNDFENPLENSIKATYTFAIEFPKLSLLLMKNSENTGILKVIKAGIYNTDALTKKINYTFVDQDFINSIKFKRDKFSHKGNYGHALIISGGEGMTGAAVLATAAALRSGCGLVTTHISRQESIVIHSTNPSAIVSIDPSDHFSVSPKDPEKYDSIGVGCGIGKKPDTYSALYELIESYSKPMVIDADAINILASNPELHLKIPKFSIFTPHPGELERLLGDWNTEQEKFEMVKHYCMQTGNYMVVKGAYSQIFTPTGEIYINSTGTPGMAKGGSGDALTGLISGLLARGLNPLDAAIFGVYIHGKAGEAAAAERGIESMNSRDIVDFIKF